MGILDPAMLSRRTILKAAGATAALAALPIKVAQAGTRTHGLSIFGDLKYAADFKHFDYVRPDAPKGGRVVFQPPNWAFNQDPQTFDTLNPFVFNGSAPPRSELPYDSLMTRALDEPDAVYALLAEWVEVSGDGNTFTFQLHPEARFHDGTPLTAEDVAFSYTLLKEQGHPNLADGLREVTSAEAIDATIFELTFSGKQSISAALNATGVPILSKSFWEGRDFKAALMEAPLGSGPYRIGRFEAGRFIEYERVEDYWARDLPVNVGHGNFGTLRLEFFRERQAEFEAFKKGEIHYREEFTSKTWATEYTFPAFADGRVKKAEFPMEARPSLQGWFYNLRRSKFADPRTRQALGLVFDFEWANKNLFFGIYSRQSSFFQKSDMAAEGMPSEAELVLLEPFRSKLPESVFGEAVMAPASDGSGRDRNNYREAIRLLKEAGWTRDGGPWTNAAGETLSIEFLIEAAVFERIMLPFADNLKSIGVDATVRRIDASQYQRRVQDFDFDIIGRAASMDATPVESLSAYFHSRLATVPGSSNISGLANDVIDALVETAGRSKNRAELTTAVKALDRVLRALWIWIPNWYSSSHRVAMWDMFGWPEEKPAYAFPVESLWWVDAEKAAKVGKG